MNGPDQIYFSGDYPDWAEASAACEVPWTEQMLEKVLAATLKIRGNEAIEKGVFRGRVACNFALITALLSAAAKNGNYLSVLDFGGSLGVSYYYSRAFLRDVSEVKWSIVELPDLVAAGRRHLESEQLRFHETIEESIRYHTPTIAVLSGVLQYLRDPGKTLLDILQIGAPIVFIDRTALIDSDRDRLCIQHVPESIYRIDLPAWFLSETKLLSTLTDSDYACLCDFPAIDNYALPGARVSFKGFICRRNR